MGKITGLGGVFIKATDPKQLAKWYQDVLGIDFNGGAYTVLPFAEEGQAPKGYNVLSFFGASSDYFNPSDKKAMLNLRVEDLVGFMEDLRKKDITFVGDMIDEEYGKFAWIMDPDGNKIELWEPPA